VLYVSQTGRRGFRLLSTQVCLLCCSMDVGIYSALEVRLLAEDEIKELVVEFVV
jgi:hypothetical protein